MYTYYIDTIYSMYTYVHIMYVCIMHRYITLTFLPLTGTLCLYPEI